jgi:N-acetylmuramoyl-L-alanine amidase
MIYVSAGHHPEKPGACYKDFCEHEEAKKWVSLIANHLGHDGMVVPVGTLRHKVDFINENYLINDIAIEIHFNSAMHDGRQVGKGSETLYYPGSKRGEHIASKIQYALGGILLPDRGIKEGWYQMNKAKGPDFFLARTKCTSLIVEPDFIHRKAKIESKRDKACSEIANTLIGIMLADEFKS